MRILRRLLTLSLLIGTCLVASSAHAEEPTTPAPPTDEHRERVYLTATYSITAIAKGGGDYIVLQPIGGEIGIRPDRRVELGFSFDYGESMSLSCVNCDARRWHGVMRARMHLVSEDHLFVPWAGGGFGYERLSVPKQNATGQDPFGGIDFVAEAGLDVKLTRGLKLGPRFAMELAFRDPDAPAWAVGATTWPYSVDAGMRLGYGF